MLAGPEIAVPHRTEEVIFTMSFGKLLLALHLLLCAILCNSCCTRPNTSCWVMVENTEQSNVDVYYDNKLIRSELLAADWFNLADRPDDGTTHRITVYNMDGKKIEDRTFTAHITAAHSRNDLTVNVIYDIGGSIYN